MNDIDHKTKSKKQKTKKPIKISFGLVFASYRSTPLIKMSANSDSKVSTPPIQLYGKYHYYLSNIAQLLCQFTLVSCFAHFSSPLFFCCLVFSATPHTARTHDDVQVVSSSKFKHLSKNAEPIKVL
jgi:hypothetical protein